jgi:Tfp pilus assembly protein PilV
VRFALRQWRNSEGFSFIEALVSAAVLSILALGIGAMTQMGNQNSKHLKVIRLAMTQRAHIAAAFANPAAWQQMVSHNSSFGCLMTSPGCGPSTAVDGFYDFIVYDSQGTEKLSYDPADSTTRPYLYGETCPAGTPDPSTDCPLKFKAKWRPQCPTNLPCLNPSIEIKVELETNLDGATFGLNAKNFEFHTIRGMNEDSIQSACLLLNGVFNSLTRTCRSKLAGKSCQTQGFPSGIVTAISSNGAITCSPLYSGTCGSGQIMTGVDASGHALCAPRAATCSPVNCVGSWSPCPVNCGGGVQVYSITQPAKYGGSGCPNSNGDTKTCNTAICIPPMTPTPVPTSATTTTLPPVTTTTVPLQQKPVNCLGNWSACMPACGGGTQTFTITQQAANGGANCSNANGDVQACGGPCPPVSTPVNCDGYWDVCDPSTGKQNFVVTQTPLNGGTACPASPQSCPVACAGGWGACSGGAKVFTVTQPALNGGASCSYADGATDSTGCGGGVDCVGSWGDCRQVDKSCDCDYDKCWGTAGIQSYTITTPASGGGKSCPAATGQTQACAPHSWGLIFPSSPGWKCSWGMSCNGATNGCAGGSGNPGVCCPEFRRPCSTPGATMTCPGYDQVAGSYKNQVCSDRPDSIITLQCF